MCLSSSQARVVQFGKKTNEIRQGCVGNTPVTSCPSYRASENSDPIIDVGKFPPSTLLSTTSVHSSIGARSETGTQ
jgi:hypothetical protein